MSEDEKKIILITDLVDQRLRKEQEIEYYEKELRKDTRTSKLSV